MSSATHGRPASMHRYALECLLKRVYKVEKALKPPKRAHLAELDTLFASLQSRAFRGDL